LTAFVHAQSSTCFDKRYALLQPVFGQRALHRLVPLRVRFRNFAKQT
jgi:hypothetical protein